ncbi:MAG: transketolase, partial [Phycisphaerae bacterium]|nr:transketolase [Phycisphaerae bacterium]
LPTLDRTECAPAEGALRGGYVLREAAGLQRGQHPDVLLLSSGSEVHQCLEAQAALAAKGVRARVVSMPCWMVFDAQPTEYRESVLPSAVRARVGVEAAAELGWGRYLGLEGEFVGMHSFGASGPASQVLKEFGFTADSVVKASSRTIDRARSFRTA